MGDMSVLILDLGPLKASYPIWTGFNADYADGREDPDAEAIVDRWDNPYHR